MQANEKNAPEGAPCEPYEPMADRTYVVVFSGEAEIIRWAMAVRAGVIRLEGKVLATRSGVCRMRFTSDTAPDVLRAAITNACKAAYAKTLARLRAGEAWLAKHRDAPDFATNLARYEQLMERLRMLWLAAEAAL